MDENIGFEKILAFSRSLETPVLVMDLSIVKNKYQELAKNFPQATIYYAVKANPSREVLTVLDEQGSNFDIASRFELDQVLALGIDSNRLSYGNTIKKAKDIAYFFEKGVRLYASDSEQDIRNLAIHAPKSKIYIRILPDECSTADWPLSRKFGCNPEMAYDLLVLAKKLGLQPYGISFHVGSQQRDIEQWKHALNRCASLTKRLRESEHIDIEMIDMGGGLPATYRYPNPPMQEYALKINKFLHEEFGKNYPRTIIIEPGRSLVADSGTLISEVILVSKKTNSSAFRWVYIDAGLFNGLIETLDESIKYRMTSEKTGTVDKTILAGPTCDSMDVMYENDKVELPGNLVQGDRLYIHATGAYTSSYASVAFNGFPPIKTVCIP